jgi:hypothetical protein
MRAEASWCKTFRWISEVDDVGAADEMRSCSHVAVCRRIAACEPGKRPEFSECSSRGLSSNDPQGSGKAQTADAICRSVVLRSNFVGDHLESCQLA